LITVVGAASKQGRSVAHALLDSGRYRVRALTRRRDSEAAQALAQRGAEVVLAPLQPGMQAELTAAMRGSTGAFLMTPPIVKVPPADLEFTLGQELANAAVAAGVEHVVFRGLANVEARTSGTKWAPHFTDKARVEAYIRSLPIRSFFVYLAFFYTNILEYYVPQRGADGLTFAIYLPAHLRMPFVDPLTATGPAVREMFDHRHDTPATVCRSLARFSRRKRWWTRLCASPGVGRATLPPTRAKILCGTFRLLAATSTSCARSWVWWNTPSSMVITHLSDRVTVTGWVPREEYHNFLRLSDAVVDLRYHAGAETAGSLARALAAGKPAIVSAAGSFLELSDEYCFKIPSGADEIGALEHAIKSLLDDDTRQRMGAAAREFARRHLRLERMARSFVEFADELTMSPAPTLGAWDPFRAPPSTIQRFFVSSLFQLSRIRDLYEHHGLSDTTRRLTEELGIADLRRRWPSEGTPHTRALSP
jgi:NmrA-like family/Glycosyl transferases group 1